MGRADKVYEGVMEGEYVGVVVGEVVDGSKVGA